MGVVCVCVNLVLVYDPVAVCILVAEPSHVPAQESSSNGTADPVNTKRLTRADLKNLGQTDYTATRNAITALFDAGEIGYKQRGMKFAEFPVVVQKKLLNNIAKLKGMGKTWADMEAKMVPSEAQMYRSETERRVGTQSATFLQRSLEELHREFLGLKEDGAAPETVFALVEGALFKNGALGDRYQYEERVTEQYEAYKRENGAKYKAWAATHASLLDHKHFPDPRKKRAMRGS